MSYRLALNTTAGDLLAKGLNFALQTLSWRRMPLRPVTGPKTLFCSRTMACTPSERSRRPCCHEAVQQPGYARPFHTSYPLNTACLHSVPLYARIQHQSRGYREVALGCCVQHGLCYNLAHTATRPTAHSSVRSWTRVKKRDALNLALNLSWTMLFSLLIPLLAGIWLDKKLGTTPLFVLIGAVLGIFAATVGVARMAIRTFSLAVGQDPDQQPGPNGEEEPE